MKSAVLILCLFFHNTFGCPHFRGANVINSKSNGTISENPHDMMRRRLDATITVTSSVLENQGDMNPIKCSSSPSLSPSENLLSESPSVDTSGRLGFCLKRALPVNRANICQAFHSVRRDFEAVTSDPLTVSSIFGISLRLVFHDAADLDVQSGDTLGSDGCLSSDVHNAGLVEMDSLVNTVLEPIWQRYCDRISRADFWVLFAKLVVEKADPTQRIRIAYQFGRKDVTHCEAAVGRLPSADFGLPKFQRVFVDQMGLTLSEGVTLLGAHTLGHTHIPNEGYGQLPSAIDPSVDPDLLNAWDDSPALFDNHYHKNLAGDGNEWTHYISTTPPENEWHKALGDPAIMLNADLALSFDAILTDEPPIGIGQKCVDNAVDKHAGCVHPTAGMSATARQVQGYIDSNALFLSDFSMAFTRMVTAGYAIEGVETTPGKSVKMGTLIPIDLRQC